MLKVVINCGRCEAFIGDCLASVRRQTFGGWQAFVTVDRRGDRTYERALEAAGGDERFVIAQNARRRYPMRNIVSAIERSGAAAEDVIVILDGDDWLIDDDAFARIVAAYEESGCWMTYGSWISNQPGHPGRWPAYRDDIADFRSERWLGTAVRTWKKWLWDLIDPKDFRDARGRWLRITEDLACMFPMFEMATTRRAHHIAEPLMLYNRLSHHDPKRRMAEEGIRNAAWLRTRPRYAPLAFTKDASESSLQTTEVRFPA
jgi:glycosyltransferase involved in cell wall biosynthesis